jgi:acetylglutamate kinase
LTTRATPSPDTAGIVLAFLESVGRRSEAELYVRLFQELPKESFAIIAVDAAVVRYATGSLVEQLRFLRELGLFAPVAVGLFEPNTAEKAAQRLAKRCADLGAVVKNSADPTLADEMRRELSEENLPIVAFGPPSAAMPGDGIDRLGDIVGALGTHKVVVLRRRGGLKWKTPEKRLVPGGLVDVELGIPVVNLRTDLPALREPGALSADDAELLSDLERILARPDCSGRVAAVTSPLNLLRELFTVKGAGTLVKRGSPIERYDDYRTIDLFRLKALFESSFGKKLDDGFFARAPLAVYVEENYRSAAVLEPGAIAPYLTKFAVERIAQGEGMGRDLWEAVAAAHRSFFWRARIENPIVSWYSERSDGMAKVGEWAVFWRGIEPKNAPQIVEEALKRPDDFVSA